MKQFLDNKTINNTRQTDILDKSKQIVIVSYKPHWNIGGTEKYNFLLIKIFKEAGYDVKEIVTVKSDETIAREKLLESTYIEGFDYEFYNYNILKKIITFFKNKKALRQHLEKIANQTSKIIFSCSFAFKKQEFIQKSIFVQHFAFKKYKSIAIRWLLGNPLKTYNNFVSFTQIDSAIFKNKYPNKIVNDIPLCGFDYLPIHTDNKTTEYNNNQINLIYVGTVSGKRKNLILLNNVAETLKINIDAYGPGSVDFNQSNYFNLKGPKTEKEIMEIVNKNNNILLISSKLEGFPFAIVQALNFGVPFVSTPCSDSLSFLVNENKNGIISKSAKFNDYLQAVTYALDKKWNRDEIKEFYNQNLSYEIFKNKWLNLIK